MDVAAELCNYGTFTSFIIVCVAVLILRKTEPERHRPFKVPFVPYFPDMGILICGGLMVYATVQMGAKALLFPAWILLGVAFYFAYGYPRHRWIERRDAKKAEIKAAKEANLQKVD